ncbi:Ferrochelatase-2 [Arachis hypogaea]|nr:Ferrochelatase-2 [Arachis hypogaea]
MINCAWSSTVFISPRLELRGARFTAPQAPLSLRLEHHRLRQTSVVAEPSSPSLSLPGIGVPSYSLSGLCLANLRWIPNPLSLSQSAPQVHSDIWYTDSSRGRQLMANRRYFALSSTDLPVSLAIQDFGLKGTSMFDADNFPGFQELKARGINNEHTLAYQSRVGPVQWLKPYIDETLVELGQKGVRSLLAVPVSFVSEHIETLEEIDMEYRKLALESGIKNWVRVPALSLSPSFNTDLADVVIEALPSSKAMYASTSTSEEEHDPLRVPAIVVSERVRKMGSKETALIFMHEEYEILKRYKNDRSSSKR